LKLFLGVSSKLPLCDFAAPKGGVWIHSVNLVILLIFLYLVLSLDLVGISRICSLFVVFKLLTLYWAL